jgi:hypothetical protein
MGPLLKGLLQEVNSHPIDESAEKETDDEVLRSVLVRMSEVNDDLLRSEPVLYQEAWGACCANLAKEGAWKTSPEELRNFVFPAIRDYYRKMVNRRKMAVDFVRAALAVVEAPVEDKSVPVAAAVQPQSDQDAKKLIAHVASLQTQVYFGWALVIGLSVITLGLIVVNCKSKQYSGYSSLNNVADSY